MMSAINSVPAWLGWSFVGMIILSCAGMAIMLFKLLRDIYKDHKDERKFVKKYR